MRWIQLHFSRKIIMFGDETVAFSVYEKVIVVKIHYEGDSIL